MQLLRANADLRAESKLEAIGEAGRSVMINGCRIDFLDEPLSMMSIFRHDAFRVLRAKTPDMRQCGVKMRNDTYIHNIVIIFCSIILIRSKLGAWNELSSSLAAAKLYASLDEPVGKLC